jgi:potassium-transporting ATPase KdpC subunit
MNILREVSQAIRSTLVLWVLVAVIYPVLILAIAQLAFPYQANGSLLKNAQGQVIGSALIGQPFSTNSYFWSRPSTTAYSTGDAQNNAVLTTGVSGASNLAPSNPALIERIKTDADKLKKSDIQPTADLLYTSGSSLDPHITPETARAQIERVAQARNIDRNKLEILINTHTDGRSLGIFGEPGVNVLELNLALDALKG